VTAEIRFAAVLGTRQRWIAGGLGVGVGFGGPFLLGVALVASSGDPSFLILPLPFLGALWVAQGLAPTGYVLTPDGLLIERRWLARLLPYAAIRGCDRRRRPIGGVGAAGLNGLFGAHGWRWNPRTGAHYLAITNVDDLVFLDTVAGLVVISPSAPDEMAARLRERLAAPPCDRQPTEGPPGDGRRAGDT